MSACSWAEASGSPSGAAGRGAPRGGQRSRPQAPSPRVLVEESDWACPICLDTIEEPYMTKCGHSFCCKCIRRSLEENNSCPKCSSAIKNSKQIYPNFLLNELVLKQRQRLENRIEMEQPSVHQRQTIQELLALDRDGLELADVNCILELLTQKKMQLEATPPLLAPVTVAKSPYKGGIPKPLATGEVVKKKRKVLHLSDSEGSDSMDFTVDEELLASVSGVMPSKRTEQARAAGKMRSAVVVTSVKTAIEISRKTTLTAKIKQGKMVSASPSIKLPAKRRHSPFDWFEGPDVDTTSESED
ncbi:E3 ubiquitin-protein ligase COP1-like [Lethenteron reissneri]|uniref:E3 ubiquitin-protein ligase COP1-like n=1 Tax=Lethenteron reissneri TaxID=7753 RepID=UPI002AB76DA5|nr:E3 ubiquitin-protein ligase COP1-like [Lethenteron reissneri]